MAVAQMGCEVPPVLATATATRLVLPSSCPSLLALLPADLGQRESSKVESIDQGQNTSRIAGRGMSSRSDGFVGLEVTKSRPFVVRAVDRLLDECYVLQGQPGYANAIVNPGDKLLLVDGVSVEEADVRGLHALLGGDLHSLVELVFSRKQSGERYRIRVRRHDRNQHCDPAHPALSQTLAEAGRCQPPHATSASASAACVEEGSSEKFLALPDQVQALTEQVQRLEGEKHELAARVNAEEDLFTRLVDRANKAEAQLAKALEETRLAQREQGELAEKVQAIGAALSGKENDLDDLANEKEQLQRQLSAEKKERAEQAAAMAAMQQTLQAQQRADSQQQEVADSLTLKETEVKTLRAELRDQHTALAEQVCRTSRAEAALREAEERLEIVEGKTSSDILLTQDELTIVRLEEDLAEETCRANRAEEEVCNLRTSLTEHITRTNAAETQAARKTEETDEAHAKMEDMSKKLAAQRDLIASFENERQDFVEHVAQQQQRAEEAHVEAARQRDRAEKFKHDLFVEEQVSHQLEDTVRALENKCNQYQREMSVLPRLLVFQEELLGMSGDVTDLETALQKFRQQCEEKLSFMVHALAKLQQHAVSVQQQNAAYQQDIERLKQEMAHLSRAQDELGEKAQKMQRIRLITTELQAQLGMCQKEMEQLAVNVQMANTGFEAKKEIFGGKETELKHRLQVAEHELARHKTIAEQASAGVSALVGVISEVDAAVAGRDRNFPIELSSSPVRADDSQAAGGDSHTARSLQSGTVMRLHTDLRRILARERARAEHSEAELVKKESRHIQQMKEEKKRFTTLEHEHELLLELLQAKEEEAQAARDAFLLEHDESIKCRNDSTRRQIDIGHQLSKAQTEVEALNQRQVCLQQQHSETISKLVETQGERDALLQRQAALERELEELRRQLKVCKETVEESAVREKVALEKIRTLHASVESLRHQTVSDQSRIEVLEASLAASNREGQLLEGNAHDIQTLKSNRECKDASCDCEMPGNMSPTVQALSQELEKQQRISENLRGELQRTSELLQEAQEELKWQECAVSVDEMATEVSVLSTRVEDLQRDREREKQKAEESEREVALLRWHCTELHARVDAERHARSLTPEDPVAQMIRRRAMALSWEPARQQGEKERRGERTEWMGLPAWTPSSSSGSRTPCKWYPRLSADSEENISCDGQGKT